MAWTRGQQAHTGRSGSQRQAANRRTLQLHHGICHVCGKPGADKVDHVTPLSQGGRDTDANRRPIHTTPCHRDKTNRESQQARGIGPTRQRPPTPHPGFVPKGGG